MTELISVRFQGKPFNIIVIQAYAPTSNTKEVEIEWFYEDLQDHLESESESHSVVSDPLWPQGLYSPQNSPGQNTRVGSLSLLQGIFPTQGSNPGHPHCRQILYQLSHKGSPRILEWVTYPFSSRSSWPRNRTGVSYIAGGFFTSWTTREAEGRLTCMYLYIWEIHHKLHNSYGPSEDVLTLIQHNLIYL